MQTTGDDSYGVLAREHRLIERVLDALGRISDEARRTRQLNGPAAELAIRFLREFADRTHHLKKRGSCFRPSRHKATFPVVG